MTNASTKKCGQCAKPAIVAVNNVPLCVDCNYHLTVAQTLNFRMNAAMANAALDDMDMVMGYRTTEGRIDLPPIPAAPIFAYGLEEHDKLLTANPARDVPFFKSNSEGFHTWTEAEVEQYLKWHKEGSKARLALFLLLYTGVRRSDVIRIGPQMVRDGWLRFQPQKTRHLYPQGKAENAGRFSDGIYLVWRTRSRTF